MTLEDYLLYIEKAEKNEPFQRVRAAYRTMHDLAREIDSLGKEKDMYNEALEALKNRTSNRAQEASCGKEYKEIKCSKCGKSFVPTDKRFKQCDSCRTKSRRKAAEELVRMAEKRKNKKEEEVCQ